MRLTPLLQTRLMDSGTSWFTHHVLLRVYLSLGMEIIGNITRWDYLFLERGTQNGARNFTWMQVGQSPHSDELVFDGVAGGGDSRVDLNLVEDGAYMSLHRILDQHIRYTYWHSDLAENSDFRKQEMRISLRRLTFSCSLSGFFLDKVLSLSYTSPEVALKKQF